MKASGSALDIDDVVHAFRWILGREPESFAAIERHLAFADRAALRRAVLLSAEFRRQFDRLAPDERPDGRFQPSHRDVDRYVFLHIPKTGGTTLHALLAAAVGQGRVSSERHNGLWRLRGHDLAGAHLFSGHYDRHCLSVVPGRRVLVVTLLREPAARLRSVYRFLRAHSAQLAARENLALAAAARELSYGEFLRRALEINPAAVDNTYLRAFGGRLPTARWEQRAEPGTPARLEDFGVPLDALLRRARDFLDGIAAVGVLEQFDRSLAVIFAALGLPPPKGYAVRQRLDDIVRENPLFEPVEEFDLSAADRELTAELTRFDVQLYRHAQRILGGAGGERDSALPAAPPPGATVAEAAREASTGGFLLTDPPGCA